MDEPPLKKPRPVVPPSVSHRIAATDTPCIVTMQEMLRGKQGLLSLAQGIVHWSPPSKVVQTVKEAATDPESNMYGADDGIDELREGLKVKLREENGLENVEVMVTSGGNQAFTNVVLALVDASDASVLFAPFYFNHMMALQMTGGGNGVVRGKTTSDLLPDVEWLAERLSSKTLPKIRMVTAVNPGNPTGVIIPKEILEKVSDLCAAHGAWFVVDNTYEYFTYEHEGAAPHHCPCGDHVVHIFSFSKAYGMMGWRVGYIAFPPALKASLMKVQDTIPICPAIVSQMAALGALKAGRPWVKDFVRGLDAQKKIVRGACEETLGKESVCGGSGAIYLFVKLPAKYMDDVAVVRWLAEQHKICVIPGSACGHPGALRVCYANLQLERCKEAAARLKAGLALIAAGTAVV